MSMYRGDGLDNSYIFEEHETFCILHTTPLVQEKPYKNRKYWTTGFLILSQVDWIGRAQYRIYQYLAAKV